MNHINLTKVKLYIISQFPPHKENKISTFKAYSHGIYIVDAHIGIT